MHSVKALISHSNTWHVAIFDEAGESQCAFDFSAVTYVAILEIVMSTLARALLVSVAARDRHKDR